MKKQIVPGESTGREVSLEWSHHRILSADSKVRIALKNSIIYSGRVEPPRNQKILMWTTSYSPPPKKTKSNHVSTNIFKLAFIFSEIKINYFFCQIKLYIIFITI